MTIQQFEFSTCIHVEYVVFPQVYNSFYTNANYIFVVSIRVSSIEQKNLPKKDKTN